jgi:hypothetical protein
MLELLLDLARLADTLAMLRETQQRYHQAEASRAVAAILRGAATTAGRLGPMSASLTGVDSSAPRPTTPTSPSITEQSTKDSHDRRPAR